MVQLTRWMHPHGARGQPRRMEDWFWGPFTARSRGQGWADRRRCAFGNLPLVSHLPSSCIQRQPPASCGRSIRMSGCRSTMVQMLLSTATDLCSHPISSPNAPDFHPLRAIQWRNWISDDHSVPDLFRARRNASVLHRETVLPLGSYRPWTSLANPPSLMMLRNLIPYKCNSLHFARRPSDLNCLAIPAGLGKSRFVNAQLSLYSIL